jgi:hypothetical protein
VLIIIGINVTKCQVHEGDYTCPDCSYPMCDENCRHELKPSSLLTLILAARAGNKLPNVYVFTEDQSKELKI